jgi:hypothetical protein
MQEERWLKVDEFPIYSVSDRGQVRNDVTGKLLKISLTRNGYNVVTICNNGKRQYFRVHRLVAKAFCENPNGEREVDHIDRNQTNNHYENLRWVSSSNNKRNKRKKAGCSSKFQGVYWRKDCKKWKAQIKTNKKNKHLGFFDSEEEASHAFRAAVAFYNLQEFYPLETL